MFWINVLEVLKGLLSPILAVGIAYIAYQQHKTNREKLRLELYDRRLKVFHSLMNFLGDNSRDGDCSHGRLSQYGAEIGESRFLFDKDITDYLEKIYTDAGNLHDLEHQIKHIETLSEERKKTIQDKRTKVFFWLFDQITESQVRFEKYLKFGYSVVPFKRRKMNWKKGFQRIAILLSFLIFVGCFGIAGYAELGGGVSEKVPDILLHFDPIYFPRLFLIGIIGVACLWLFYWIMVWVLKKCCWIMNWIAKGFA